MLILSPQTGCVLFGGGGGGVGKQPSLDCLYLIMVVGKIPHYSLPGHFPNH